MTEKKIYVLVAGTVQNPLTMKYETGSHFVMVPTPDTKTIVQPKGRIAAQVGHVVSLMRQDILIEAAKTYVCRKPANRKGWPELENWYREQKALASKAITTIVLAVPDSYQLEFRHGLIRETGIRVYPFYDENEEYGLGAVKTAICTGPVAKERLRGTLDYLELWS